MNKFPPCAAYITGRDKVNGKDPFEVNKGPFAITCGNKYGDIWAPDYQLASCCTGDGRYFVMTG